MLKLKLALRFVRSRRKGALTRFISFASTCGIAIGVFAAIVGFSAMNGFEYELEHRVLSIIPSAQLNASDPYFRDPDAIQEVLAQSPEIVATSAALDQRAIVSANRAFAPLMISGIKSAQEKQVIAIQRFVSIDLECLDAAQYPSLSGNCALDGGALAQDSVDAAWDKKEELSTLPRIILGAGVAKKLGVGVGDEVSLVTLDNAGADSAYNAQSINRSFKTPQRHKAQVIGLISIGGQLDSVISLMNFDDLKVIANLQGPNSIHIRTSNLQRTNQIVFAATSGKIQESAYLVTWMNSQGKLYHDIQMVRQIMFISMFLVLAVACFNIVSNLLMLVGEKRREIAILLTMGMKPSQVVGTFSLMALISGGYGALIGLVLGVITSLTLTPLTLSFKDWFGFELLNEEVYFINFIPCRLELMDVVLVLTISLVMSWLAALYPALRAARIAPAKELNL